MHPSPIRQVGPEAAAIVARMLHDFNAEFEEPVPGAAQLAARFLRLLARPDVLVLVAGRVAEPTGFAFLTLRPTPYSDGPLAQLEKLYVRPQSRGQGLGGRLLIEAIRRVRVEDAEHMHISVDETDEDARRFYEWHGFVNTPVGESSRYLSYVREF